MGQVWLKRRYGISVLKNCIIESVSWSMIPSIKNIMPSKCVRTFFKSLCLFLCISPIELSLPTTIKSMFLLKKPTLNCWTRKRPEHNYLTSSSSTWATSFLGLIQVSKTHTSLNKKSPPLLTHFLFTFYNKKRLIGIFLTSKRMFMDFWLTLLRTVNIEKQLSTFSSKIISSYKSQTILSSIPKVRTTLLSILNLSSPYWWISHLTLALNSPNSLKYWSQGSLNSERSSPKKLCIAVYSSSRDSSITILKLLPNGFSSSRK